MKDSTYCIAARVFAPLLSFDQVNWRELLLGASSAFDRVNESIGRIISWLVPLMVMNTFAVAVLRYAFDLGWVWLQETYIWMHGTIIMMGVGYTLLHEGHVRVDILYEGFSSRAKAWINLLGVLLFLIPMVGVLIWIIYPYVSLSWSRLESSREAGGIPAIFILKSTMLLFCGTLGLQGISLGLRSFLEIINVTDSPDEHSTHKSINEG